MRASSTALCNNILLRGRNEKIQITPMKLQKLLYYVCVKYQKRTGEYPLSEYFEVWKYGPVLSSAYYEFKTYGSEPIRTYALDSKGRAMIVSEAKNPILKQCIDYVWNKLKNYSGIELSERTHQKGSGWYRAYKEGRTAIQPEDMIYDETI